MKINLKDIVWPISVIQCNEALTRLEPGENLAITVSDPDVVDNIVLLIKSRPDLQFEQSRELESYQIRVRRQVEKQNTGREPVQKATN